MPVHAGLAKTGPGEIEITGERATLYLMGAFGASKFEAAEFRIGRLTSEGNRLVQWRKPRARKWEGQRSKNLLVVLDGLGHPDHPVFDRSEDGRSETTRYATFDPAWRGDFDRFLEGYLESSGAGVLLDARLPRREDEADPLEDNRRKSDALIDSMPGPIAEVMR